MAYASNDLIEALREAARRLRQGTHYAWGHHGACNCGQLLQVITKLDESEILAFAQSGQGEWTELGENYCDTSGTPVGLMISQLQEAGLTPTDIHHLEYLSDKEILRALPGGFRWLKKNERQDLILYMEAFASILEEKLFNNMRFDLTDCVKMNSSSLLDQVPETI